MTGRYVIHTGVHGAFMDATQVKKPPHAHTHIPPPALLSFS